MKTEKRQFGNRMGAAVLLLALFVLMDMHKRKINHQTTTVVLKKKATAM